MARPTGVNNIENITTQVKLSFEHGIFSQPMARSSFFNLALKQIRILMP